MLLLVEQRELGLDSDSTMEKILFCFPKHNSPAPLDVVMIVATTCSS